MTDQAMTDAPPDELTAAREEAVGSAAYNKYMRMAQMFVEKYRDDFLYVIGLGWHKWDGTRYRFCEDTKDHYRAMQSLIRRNAHNALTDNGLRRDLNSVQSYAGQTDALKLVATQEGMIYRIDDMDSAPHLINLKNGTYNLHTRELQPHNREDRITMVMGGSFAPNAAQDRRVWDDFLASVLPDPAVRDYLQRFVGMSLFGAVIEHNMLVLKGDGRNGKGVFYGRIANAFADYAAIIEASLIMTGRNTRAMHDTLEIAGKRWVYRAELSGGGRISTEDLKRITGGDRLKGRRLYKEPVEFEPSHSMILITNDLPRIAAEDSAAWERIRIVPFEVYFAPEERDGQLGAKLDRNLDAVIAWMIQGWEMYCSDGMQEPGAVLVATEEVREEFDHVKEFLDDTYDRVDGALTEVNTAVFAEWELWAARNRTTKRPPALTRMKLYAELDRLGLPRATGRGNKTYIQGITLRPRGLGELSMTYG